MNSTLSVALTLITAFVGIPLIAINGHQELVPLIGMLGLLPIFLSKGI